MNYRPLGKGHIRLESERNVDPDRECFVIMCCKCHVGAPPTQSALNHTRIKSAVSCRMACVCWHL